MPTKDRIVFLDAGSVDYGDVDMSCFQKLGYFKAYFHTKPEQLSKRLKNVSIVITNKFVLNEDRLNTFSHLKSIHVTATGTNNIDLEAAKKLKIAVTNVPGYSTESVVACTISFLLMLSCRSLEQITAVQKDHWSKSPFFAMREFPFREIHGKTICVVGYGAIGKRVAEIAHTLGMKVILAQIPGRKYSDSKHIPLSKALAQADFTSIHAPLTSLTKDLFNEKVIFKMKKGSFLINMARGGIVNEKALDKALRKKHLAGAALDVLETEPPKPNHFLLKTPNLLITPHVAWAGLEARKRLIEEVFRNIQSFQKGLKRNRVA